MNNESSLTSVPTFFICRIMSDEHNLLEYECGDQGDTLLNQSEDLEEPMKLGEATLTVH